MIDPRRMRVLQAVALQGSVTGAAESLHLTPSAVSQQIGALEREVGQELIDRIGRGIRLTPAGAILARHARRLSAVLEEAEADLAATSQGAAGEVVVAAFSSAISEVVAPAVSYLRDAQPKIRVLVKDAEGPESQRLLAEGQVDIAIAVAHHEGAFAGADDLRRDSLYTEPFDAIVPLGHKHAGSTPVSLFELQEEIWVTAWPGNPIYDITFHACEEAGFRPRVGSVSNDFRAACSMVAAGLGVALVPRSALRGLSYPLVRQVSLAEPVPARSVFVTVRRGTERHPVINTVLGALHHAAEGMRLPGRR